MSIATKYSLVLTIACVSLIGGFSGCSPVGAENPRSLTVTWTPEFSMPELLAEPVTLKSQQDLQSLLSRHWYAAIDVQTTGDSKPLSLNNCNEYFVNNAHSLHSLREHESSAFVELQIMCEATRLLANAKMAHRSYLPDSLLNPGLPRRLPKAVAFVTSETESERMQQDEAKQFWGDVNTITRTIKVSENEMEFHSDAGRQTLSVIGQGDMNGDGVQDVLLLSRDTVVGGSYANMRLFILTVNAEDRWELIDKYLK
jgi:hypothetical protein